ncbi:MAG TPA: hypothetical protein VLA14_08510 [Polyangia bacterium]|nr:hypothetical protein [Polyangia bacterium]
MKAAHPRALVALTIGVLVGCGGAKNDARDAGGNDGRPGDANATMDAGCAPACAANQTCVLGACQPTPVQVATMPRCGVAHLIVGGATLYWTESATGAVKSLATATPGGAPTVVASSQPMPGALAVDDTNVYWANDGDLSLVKAPLAGAAPTPLLTAPALVSGILANGGTIYYGAGASTYALPSASTAPTTLMTFATCKQSHTGALALDVDHLYQTDYLNQFLSRERIDGTQETNNPCSADQTTVPKIAAPDTISHSQGDLFEGALTVVEGQLIWADSSNLYGKAASSTTATGALTLATTADAGAVTGFVVSGASVYLGESGADESGGDAVEVAPLDPGDAGPGTATIIAMAGGAVSQFAADATHVYWVVTSSATDGGAADCAIMSLAK